MTWDQYVSLAVLAAGVLTALFLALSFRRRPALKVAVTDQPDGRVLVRIEHGDYSVTANVADHTEANAFVKDEVAHIKAEWERAR